MGVGTGEQAAVASRISTIRSSIMEVHPTSIPHDRNTSTLQHTARIVQTWNRADSGSHGKHLHDSTRSSPPPMQHLERGPQPHTLLIFIHRRRRARATASPHTATQPHALRTRSDGRAVVQITQSCLPANVAADDDIA